MVVIETPFEISQVMWEALGTPRQVTIPCPVCAGKRRVTVILGSGEHVSVECDGCGLGYDAPRGVVEEYEHEPSARQFVIGGVKSMHGDDWIVFDRDDNKRTINFANLFSTEADALAKAREQSEARHESNLEARARKRAGTRRMAWSIRYHRQNIADCERKIAWHRSRIEARKESDCGGS